MKNRIRGNITLLCCLVYFASYLTRLDYAAAMAEIVRDMGVSKQLAGIAVTGSFFTYGAGQIFSGMLGDRFDPRKVIGFGLVTTSLVNFSMSLLPGIRAMAAVWCFNGFFQSLIWPPMTRILVGSLDHDAYNSACTKVNTSASAATVAVYLIVPLAIFLSGWRLAFIVNGTCALIVAALWLYGTRDINAGMPARSDADPEDGLRALPIKGGLLPVLIAVMAAIVLHGCLRDGITTWMPLYISEVFHMGTSASILTTTILPVFSIASLVFSAWLNRRIGNELKTTAALFGAALVCSCALVIFFGKSVIAEALMMALITACMHGINLMLIGIVPGRFSGYGKISTIAGVLNACAYLGSTVSTYGFAVLSEAKGWRFAAGGWTLMSALGAAVCLIALPGWLKFVKSRTE